jgi:hypothetical protein
MTSYTSLKFSDDLKWFSVLSDQWIRLDTVTKINVIHFDYIDHVKLTIQLGLGESSDSVYATCRNRSEARNMMASLMNVVSGTTIANNESVEVENESTGT